MSSNPLKRLEALGQSIWLDYIRRDLIARGGLPRLIEEDGLRGMTSNPSIFEKAIADSHDYDEDIRAMALAGQNVEAIYETLGQRDVQSAADEFRSERAPPSPGTQTRQSSNPSSSRPGLDRPALPDKGCCEPRSCEA